MQLFGQEIRTLAQCLSLRAVHTPERTAYVCIGEDGEAQQYDFRYIYTQSAKIAGLLHEKGIRQGDRCLLMCRQNIELICGIFGCWLCGAAIVPLDRFRPSGETAGCRTVAENCGAACILTNDAEAALLSEYADSLGGLPVYHTAQAAQSAPYQTDSTAEPVLLQYTSGSTSAPKGTMVTNSSLLSNLEQMCCKIGLTEASRWLSWIPYRHDMGLIAGLLTAAYCGNQCIFMEPELFRSHPETWITGISRFQATHTVAPNFAYELICGLLKGIAAQGNPDGISLASLERLISGSEAVRFRTLMELIGICRQFGLRRGAVRTGYGLAEATLVLTTDEPDEPTGWVKLSQQALAENRVEILGRGLLDDGDPSAAETPDAVYLVGNGTPIAGNLVAVVSPDGETLPPLEIGEVCACGPTLAAGYWNAPEQTAETFVREPDGRVTLHTGDAGFFDTDGKLYITGRFKDMIVIHGVNYYPADLEETASGSHPALQYASCAFSASFSEENSIVIVQEIRGKTAPQAVLREASEQIRRRIYEAYRLQPEQIILTAEHSIPRTEAGKIRHRATRELFLANRLGGVLYASENPHRRDLSGTQITCEEDVQKLLCGLLADALGRKPAEIDPDQPFMQMGLSSELNIETVRHLNTVPGLRLSVADIFSYNTVTKMSAYIYRTFFAGAETDPDSMTAAELAKALADELD